LKHLKLRKTSSTPAVVPGSAPALAKAGVGGFVQPWDSNFLKLGYGAPITMVKYIQLITGTAPPGGVLICFQVSKLSPRVKTLGDTACQYVAT